MKEMYYILGLAGWIWLALVAPLLVGAWIVQWHRRSREIPTDATESKTVKPTDEKQP